MCPFGPPGAFRDKGALPTVKAENLAAVGAFGRHSLQQGALYVLQAGRAGLGKPSPISEGMSRIRFVTEMELGLQMSFNARRVTSRALIRSRSPLRFTLAFVCGTHFCTLRTKSQSCTSICARLESPVYFGLLMRVSRCPAVMPDEVLEGVIAGWCATCKRMLLSGHHRTCSLRTPKRDRSPKAKNSQSQQTPTERTELLLTSTGHNTGRSARHNHKVASLSGPRDWVGGESCPRPSAICPYPTTNPQVSIAL
jgi:hypothetical protein